MQMFGAQLKTWGGALTARIHRKARRGPRTTRRPPPRLEALEPRLAPATYTWSQTGPGTFNWNDAANWGGAGFPGAAGDVANLTAALTGNETVNLNVPVTLGTLTVGSSAAAGAFAVAANGGSLTFQSASGGVALNEANQGGDALNAPITLKSPLTATNTSPAALTVGGALTIGGHAITVASGTVVLNGGGSGAGAVTVAAGATLAGTGALTPAPDLLIASSFFDSAVYEFNASSGALFATLVAPYTSSLLSGPAGLTVGPDGNLYISSQFNDAILQYNFRTESLSTFIPASVLGPIATAQGDSVFAPAGLRFDAAGNLYVSLNAGQSATSGGAVVRFSTTSSAGALAYGGTATTIATGFIQPAGLTFGTASGDTGNLYVSNSGAQDVVKITGAATATPTSSTFIASGSHGLDFPSGLTFGPDGKLYLVDLGAISTTGRVLRYNADGSFDEVFTPTGSAGDLSFQFPSDALFDAQGHLLTANLGPAYPPALAGSINRYNGDGTFDQTLVSSSQFPSTGTGTSGISPSQLALAPAPVVTVGGTLRAGGTTTPGALTVGDVTFASTGTFSVALNGPTPGTGYGQLVSTGTVHLNNATLDASIGYAVAAGAQFDIVSDAANPVDGTFLGLPEGHTLELSGQEFVITYHGGASGHAVVLTRLPAALVISDAPFSTTAGDTFTFTVTAVGPDGATDTGYTGTVTFIATDGNATLPLDYTFTPADAGSHTFDGVVLRTAGARFIIVYDTAEARVNGLAPFSVTPAAADHFVVLTAADPIVAGTAFDVTVLAVDAYGNVDTNYTGTVRFRTSDPDPTVTLPPDTVFQSGNAGVIFLPSSVTLLTQGDQSLSVDDLFSGITGSTNVLVS
jgi:sugar lactone lactonase YvrE